MTSTVLSDAGGPARTVFFGSGTFAVPILDAIANLHDLEIVAVVTPPDRPAGRSSVPLPVPVAVRALALGLPLLQVARVRTPEARSAIAGSRPDLGVLADFGQLIPAALVELPRYGILNVHPSALPRHRGATPIPAAILAGDAEGGVSIMQMDAGLDTGPLLAVHRWPLTGQEDFPGLEAVAAVEGARLLLATLPAVLARRAVGTPQDPASATLTRPLARGDGRLDPARPAAALERQVRAYRPWPGTFLEVGPVRLAVLAASASAAQPGDVPGRLVAAGAGLALATANGRLDLEVVRPAGGRAMDGPEFRRGHGSLIASALAEEALP